MGSIENIKNFYEHLAKDRELQKKLSNKVLKISNERKAMQTITNFAKNQNYNFNVDDLEQFIKNKSKTLSAPAVNDEQLSNVAGGANEYVNNVEE